MILTFKGDYPNEPVVCTWAHFLAHLRFPMPTWLALLLVYSLEVLKFYNAYEFLGDLVKLQVLIEERRVGILHFLQAPRWC